MVEVLIATYHFHPEFGGAGLRLRGYAQRFRDAGSSLGVSMRFFTRDLEDPNRKKELLMGQTAAGFPTEDGLRVDRVELRNSYGTIGYTRSFVSLLLKYCRNLQTRPDIIIFVTLDFWMIPEILRLRSLGVKVIYLHTLRGAYSDNPIRRALQWARRMLVYNCVDTVITSSGVNARALSAAGVIRPIEVISNGVDLKRFVPLEVRQQGDDLREELGINLDAKIILFVGRLNQRKGADLIVDAFIRVTKQEPDAHLILVGPTDTDLVGSLVAKLDNVNLKAQVTQAGLVVDVEKYYQIADVFVFPSRREGFGNAVLEAYSTETPCVLTPFVGLPDEFGVAEEHYLLAEHDADAIAVQIKRILDSPELAESLSRRAKQLVTKTSGVESSLSALASVFGSLVGDREISQHL
jgi:glycosyltransferase involved in cell wall biosynthesis